VVLLVALVALIGIHLWYHFATLIGLSKLLN
jgi:hypothetical protein